MSRASDLRLIRAALALLGASFLAVGTCFLLLPGEVTDALTSLGDGLGGFAEPPEEGLRLWLSLSFAYMVTIAGLCLLAAVDPVRNRALLVLLAVAKAASSGSALGFYLLTDDVFIYLLNFIVDGALVAVALGLWVAIGRIGTAGQDG